MSLKYRHNAFYNGVNSFRSAFPQLGDAVVELRERRGPDDERSVEMRKIGFRRGNFTQGVVACSNPLCHEGGYQIDRLVADMLRNEELERSGIMLCSGRETGEEVRRGPVRCPHRVDFHVVLTPRREGEEEHDRRPHDRRSRHRGPRRRGHAA